MKLNIKAGSADLKSRDVVTSVYKIQQNSKMFDILSSKLYTDKILATIRELLCNAYDAHVAAGKPELAIQVTITENFTVRDFGKGLSIDDMEELYTTYGASNKADSNNFIGCLGLGSKSPFAYTDTFTVISRHKGMRHQFVCSMSDSIPSIHRFESVPMSSSERTGLEVSFPIRNIDSGSFRNKLVEFAKLFCAPIRYSCDGSSYIELDRTHLDFGKHGVASIKTSTSYGNKSVAVLMGGVAYDYQLPDYNEQFGFTREQFDTVSYAVCEYHDHKFVIKAELGDVDIAASREQCEQRPRTAMFVIGKLLKYITSIENEFLKSLDPKIKLMPKLLAWSGFLLRNSFLSDRELVKTVTAAKQAGNLFCPYTEDEIRRNWMHDAEVIHIFKHSHSKSRSRVVLEHMPEFFEAGSLASPLTRQTTTNKLQHINSGKVLFVQFPLNKKKQLPMSVHDSYPSVSDFFLFSDVRLEKQLDNIGMPSIKFEELNIPKIQRVPTERTRIAGGVKSKSDGIYGLLEKWSVFGATADAASSHELFKSFDQKAMTILNTAGGYFGKDDPVWSDPKQILLVPAVTYATNRVTVAPEFINAVLSKVCKGSTPGYISICAMLLLMRSAGYTVLYRRFNQPNILDSLSKSVKKAGTPDPVNAVAGQLKKVAAMPMKKLEDAFLSVLGAASLNFYSGYDKSGAFCNLVDRSLKLLTGSRVSSIANRLYGGLDRIDTGSKEFAQKKLLAVSYVIRTGLDKNTQHYIQLDGYNFYRSHVSGTELMNELSLMKETSELNNSGLWLLRVATQTLYSNFSECMRSALSRLDSDELDRVLTASELLHKNEKKSNKQKAAVA